MPEFLDDDGIRVVYYEWPVVEPKAAVQIVHGLGEHASRYGWLAERLNRAGYAVYGNDHRGHGRTGIGQAGGDPAPSAPPAGERGSADARLGRLGPGGLRAVERGVTMLSGIVRRREPGVPLVLLGHSWGALMAQRVADHDPLAYDALVLSGTGLRMPWSLNPGDLNRRFRHLGRTGYEWLSRDPAVVRAAVEDPLMFHAEVLGTLGLRDSLRLYGRPSPELPAELPVLILVGSEDSVSGERGSLALANAYLRAGLVDVELIVYRGARHEVYNETNREQVAADLIAWLDERMPRPVDDAAADGRADGGGSGAQPSA